MESPYYKHKTSGKIIDWDTYKMLPYHERVEYTLISQIDCNDEWNR